VQKRSSHAADPWRGVSPHGTGGRHGDDGTGEISAPSPGRALYEKRFPDSSPLFGFGGFLLFRLVPREARFVAGFARAYSVDAEELKKAAAARLGP